MVRIGRGEPVRNPRSAMNDVETMQASAQDMVAWYQQSLGGAFFQNPRTLVEFKRIHGMADVIAFVAPPDTVAYAKGGSIAAGAAQAQYPSTLTWLVPGTSTVRAIRSIPYC
jgi:beta-lactamase class A